MQDGILNNGPHPSPSIGDLERIKPRLPKHRNLDIYLEEARFGFKHIAPALGALHPDAKVLEVGAGSCLLLHEVTTAFPSLQVVGVEPASIGFQTLDQFIDELSRIGSPMQVRRCGYEAVDSDERFDLIYLVNVFEHLPDWPAFLHFIRNHLSPGGRCIALFPNYSFPYEPHFSIPIVFSKGLTKALFAKRIARFESETDCEGLWTSLNFVTCAAVEKAARAAGLVCTLDQSITNEMIDRVQSDMNFAKRHRTLGRIAQMALKTPGLERALKGRALRRWTPYLHATFQLAGA